MKKFHPMVKGIFSTFLLSSLCVFISSANAGVLYFKMTAPKTTLQVGEEMTVRVSAWIDDTVAAGNGLDTWQVDLSVSQTGIVEITKTGTTANISLLAPDPDPTWSGWSESSINQPNTGEARNIAVMQTVVGAASDIGVGGYSAIFTFTIKALAVGTVTYSICDDGGTGFFGILADGTTEYDNDIIAGSVAFDAQNSIATFTVIPEPASIAVFAVAGLLSVIRKK